jgi:hypothetical protein
VSVFDYLFTDDIQIRHLTGTNAGGTKTYNPPRGQDPAIIKGRLEFSRKLITKADGQQFVSEGVLRTAAVVATGDLIIYGAREWPVQYVPEKRSLFSGIDHREARL